MNAIYEEKRFLFWQVTKKKEYTPFPPDQKPRKEDIEMAQGVYFLKEAERKRMRAERKRAKAKEVEAQRKRERAAAFVAPSEGESAAKKARKAEGKAQDQLAKGAASREATSLNNRNEGREEKLKRFNEGEAELDNCI